MARGHFRLTPLYDVISAWPVVGKKGNQIHESELALAMALRGKNKHCRVAEIRRDHFNMTAGACGFGPDMNELITRIVATTPAAVEHVGKQLPMGLPALVFDTVTAGLTRACRTLEATRRV